MSDWLRNLRVPWMALLVFGFTYLLAAAIYAGIATLAVGERMRRRISERKPSASEACRYKPLPFGSMRAGSRPIA
jgi:hypothetical protein